ncbi:MAG: aminotransferase class I/II-fold pyridoxal phosphate-dependent enzyme [Sphaerochaetaceae bacterium]
MQALALELNKVLEGTVASDLLSEVGKRMYFPKGIVAQSAEAKTKATLYNATIGMATKDGQPMYLSDIYDQFVPGAFKPNQLFSYAPGGGDPVLRDLWKAEMLKKNPSLAGKHISRPIVTGGLTHSLSVISLLFAKEGDTLVIPDLAWDNYELIYTSLNNATIKTFKMYDAADAFNVAGMVDAIKSVKSKKVRVLLNFPNNPTGYTPSKQEMSMIVEALKELAEDGYELLVITDDAYFGLFYEDKTAKESLFASLCDAHPNILAVKGDAATKEAMVWGFRIAFVTFGCKGMTDEQYDALDKKMLGMIRATVSNCDHPGQTLLVHAMQNSRYQADKDAVFSEMEERYRTLKESLRSYVDKYDLLKPYPFNSGYFMAFSCKGSAEALRKHLLDDYHIGCINIADRTLRLAYCSVPREQIPGLVRLVFQAAGELWS